MEHVRPARSLEAEADLAASVNVAVVKIYTHRLPGCQRRKCAPDHFVAAETAPQAECVAAWAINVKCGAQVGTSQIAKVIIRRAGAECGTATRRRPRAAPASVAVLRPGISQSGTRSGYRERGR